MKRILAIVLFAAILASAGCAASTPEYTIELAGNATTGCAWEYTMNEEGIVTELSNDYISDPSDADLVGVGGTYVFTFAPAAEGDVTLHFIYRQPWEPNTIYDECDYVLHSDGKSVTLVGEAPATME